MATRRMFSISLINSDSFVDLPHEAQLLYFFLLASSDDDVIISSAKRIVRINDVDPKCLDILTENRFLIQIDRCYVVRHWLTQNNITPQKYQPSNNEARRLLFVDEATKIYYSFEESRAMTSTKLIPLERFKGGGKTTTDESTPTGRYDSEQNFCDFVPNKVYFP